jgi:hypothetical protein
MTAAAVDRVVHHAVILELPIPSYRAQVAKARRHVSSHAARIAAAEMLPRRNRGLIYNATGRWGRRERSIDEEATERDESSGVDEFAAGALPFRVTSGKMSDLGRIGGGDGIPPQTCDPSSESGCIF